ncbi:GrpE-domain-containing protein [Basidiobolus meristosporus CBS 931.73]|uniref:GrpE protein homolog n=1 Tax=Basidiobolus meristosporus CBS 931.73 TaxID=1314790 RepID=A0A1Y1XT39_9FUNG|nr:GrpE-domain-containing protein [Basidiobolus meristosporus CBS 931.73]|eukprot:ORX88900.1 GrpE-domain-containing protein [Basidiobolus meristosporus CBS 931.73]
MSSLRVASIVKSNFGLLSAVRPATKASSIRLGQTGVRFYSDKQDEEKTEKTETPATEESKTEATEEDKEKKLAEIKDAYLRCLAEMENVRNRTRKEIEQASQFAITKFAKDLLNTVDILNMALKAVPEQARGENDHLKNLYTGVSMTEAELVKALNRHGVVQDNPAGQKFDPNVHQALYQVPMPDKEPGTIISVEKVGYLLRGRVLRAAQVGVVQDRD